MSRVVGILVLCCLLATATGMRCYECNVWKAGYGNLCIQPRIRDKCISCMKIETTIFMGFYKNTPRTSTVISRTCALSKAVPYKTGCVHVEMADGHSRRCYCDTDLCNGASRQTSPVSLFASTAVALGALFFWRHAA
jgi:hypothetical protein